MRKSFIALVLGVLLTIPCVVRAEEVEIQLMEVITMQPLPGDDPLDGPTQSPNEPPRPNNFRATINVNNLSITKLYQHKGAVETATFTQKELTDYLREFDDLDPSFIGVSDPGAITVYFR